MAVSNAVGTLSWTLTILAANGALTAALLARATGNRMANRFLAALVGLISLRLAIYVLGFAGAYDSHRWITFLPLDASLAFGPLLWLYIVALTRGDPPPAGTAISFPPRFSWPIRRSPSPCRSMRS